MGFAALSNSADGFHSVQHCLENLFSLHASKPQRILLIGATSAYTVSCQLPFLHSLPSQFPTPVVILRIIPDFIPGIVKKTSAQTLGSSIWEILVNSPLFSPALTEWKLFRGRITDVLSVWKALLGAIAI